MKKLLFLPAMLLLVYCSKKEKEDNLLKVKNEKVNTLIRKYYSYEKEFTEAIKKGDAGEIKKYSDSANYYDEQLFNDETMKLLSNEEKVKYSEQINTIRAEKIEKLSKLNQK